jgi:hypothetical protein
LASGDRAAAGAGAAPIVPAVGDRTLPRGGAIEGAARAGSFGGGRTGSAARAAGAAAGAVGLVRGAGAGALGAALDSAGSAGPPSSAPRFRSREKMLMLPPDATFCIDDWRGRL